MMCDPLLPSRTSSATHSASRALVATVRAKRFAARLDVMTGERYSRDCDHRRQEVETREVRRRTWVRVAGSEVARSRMRSMQLLRERCRPGAVAAGSGQRRG